jgi:predicted AAA+ superfamily ATPase
MPFSATAAAMGMVENVPQLNRFRIRDLMSDPAKEAIRELWFHQDALEGAWENYLMFGGFPTAVDSFLKTGDVSPTFVDSLWQVINGEAIRQGARITEAELAALLNRLSENLGSPLNTSSLARDSGLGSHHRVSDRLDDLTRAFLAWRCYRNRAGLPHLGSQPKFYFIDPVVAQLMWRKDNRYFEPDLSMIAEQQLGLVLARSIEHEMPGSFIDASQITYERTTGGAEIDFVGTRLEMAFESKYVDQGWKSGTKTLVSHHERGIVATRSAFDVDGPVWAVPAGIIAWLLGA